MRSYTVHRRPNLSDGRQGEADGLVFVREGFCWPALAVPALWLIYRRLWLALLGFIVIIALIGQISTASGLDATGVFVVLMAAQALLAAEAYDLWRWTLKRSGYEMIGIATGANIMEAEMQYFRSWLAQPQTTRTLPPASSVPSMPRTLQEPVAGLFDPQGPA